MNIFLSLIYFYQLLFITITITIREVYFHLIKTEGYRGLFKGFTMNLFKGPITLSISLTTYYYLRNWINEYDLDSNTNNSNSHATISHQIIK